MAYSLQDINGALVLGWLNKGNVGGFNEADINQDISFKDDKSTPALAIFQFGQIAAKAQLDPDDFTLDQTAIWDAALLWYICALYEDFNLKEEPCDTCCDDKGSTRNIYYRKACECLEMIDSTLATSAAFCVESPEGELDDDLFGSRYYSPCRGAFDKAATKVFDDQESEIDYTLDFLI